ncbi:MAG: carboxypeptidase regulatory-like domain-containing protein [Candidatus Electryonea clarkiae]|nr:carboxypeptidase regulatory-like domain-containing protein [Candidatus Electryonea clarkiae]MDP8287904.1 carboxypeptidase regulatory-like domain-containing protein [Candidatus Electryonea clarkiae]
MRWLNTLVIISILFLPVLVAARTGGPDDYGYEFIDSQEEDGPEYNWIDISETGTEITDLYGWNRTVGPLEIPFDFIFYGTEYDEFWICVNIWISFSSDQGTASNNQVIPTNTNPNNAIFLFWAAFDPSEQGFVPRAYYGEDEDGNLVIQIEDWYSEYGGTVTTEAILFPDGNILFQYQDVDLRVGPFRESIGIENSNGSIGLQISNNRNPADYPFDSLAILITPPDLSASVEGTVSDFHTGDPVEDAIVRYLDHGDHEATTDENGDYAIEAMLPGDYTVEIEADGYVSIEETDVELEEGDNIQDFVLRYPASLWFDPVEFEVRVITGQVDNSNILTIRNDGGVDLEWGITCNVDWLSLAEDDGTLEPEEEIDIILSFDATAIDIDEYEMSMTIFTNDPDNLEVEIPASMLVDYEPPAFFNLMEPEDQEVYIYEEQGEIQFAWEFAIDPDPFGMPIYNLYVQAVVDGNPLETIQVENIENVGYALDVIDSLGLEHWEDSLTVEWRVSAVAEPDTVQCEQSFTFFFEPNTGVLGTTNSELPKEFAISAIYPNPFNQTTCIHFALPRNEKISLIIYDLHGREVIRLIDGDISPAGWHQVMFEGSDIASGIYFIQMKVEHGFTETAKVLLIK